LPLKIIYRLDYTINREPNSNFTKPCFHRLKKLLLKILERINNVLQTSDVNGFRHFDINLKILFIEVRYFLLALVPLFSKQNSIFNIWINSMILCTYIQGVTEIYDKLNSLCSNQYSNFFHLIYGN